MDGACWPSHGEGRGQNLGVDRILAKWALDEGIIVRKADGEYKLTASNGGNGEKEGNSNSSFVSETSKLKDEEDREHDHEGERWARPTRTRRL